MYHAFEPILGLLVISTFSGLLGLLAFIFWLWMLIDAIKNPRLDGSQRVIWILVIIFIPCLGSLIYYFAGRS
jgi:hypothetical protein